MNKEQFLTACDKARCGFMTALQVFLGITILPALLVVIVILWIEDIKD